MYITGTGCELIDCIQLV